MLSKLIFCEYEFQIVANVMVIIVFLIHLKNVKVRETKGEERYKKNKQIFFAQ